MLCYIMIGITGRCQDRLIIGLDALGVQIDLDPMGRCCVVGSALAFRSMGPGFWSPSTAYFHIIVHHPLAS